MKKYLGVMGLILVTVIWGGGFVASDIALNSIKPFPILTVRFFIGTLCMFLMCIPALKGITIKEAKAGITIGLFLFGGFAFQMIGLQYTTPSKNAFLTATNVVFVPLITFLLYRKKIAKQGIAGAVMALIGAGVLSLNGQFEMGAGDALTLLCAVCFAFQILLTGVYIETCRATVLNFFQMATAFVCSLMGLFMTGGINNIQPDREGIISVLYLGIVSTTLTYLLQTTCQKYLDETKAAIILSMEAVFGTIFSIILLHEIITVKMLIGCVLILGAVLVSEIKWSIPGTKL